MPYVLKQIDEIELKIKVLGTKSSKFGDFFHTLKGLVGKTTCKRAFDWLIFHTWSVNFASDGVN